MYGLIHNDRGVVNGADVRCPNDNGVYASGDGTHGYAHRPSAQHYHDIDGLTVTRVLATRYEHDPSGWNH